MKRSFEIPARSWRCVSDDDNPMGVGMIELSVAAENDGA
jgi:hypothetical protein